MRTAAIVTAALAAAAVVPSVPAVTVAAAPVAAGVPEVHHDHHSHSHEPGGVAADAAPAPAAAPAPTREAPLPVRPATIRPVADPGARFRTPEAAMRHLAAAYNRRDLAALKDVTTPDARKELDALRAMASDLRLDGCTWDSGYYTCTFTHAHPATDELGKAWFLVAPARRPGWYMTVMEGCG